jgi:hypothetical protein
MEWQFPNHKLEGLSMQKKETKGTMTISFPLLFKYSWSIWRWMYNLELQFEF